MNVRNLRIEDVRNLLIHKKISAAEYINEYLQNIRSSKLNTFITINENAEAEACHIDEIIRKGEELPPLAGIPVAVKDNISTKDIRTTCGSKMLENYIPPYDATVVERLKKAGAIIIGKTNMDEFGMGNSSENSIAGAAKNPYDHSRTAGGSSGGSAAAVAGGECLFSIGTDTGGSVRQPAAMCGIIGVKPTYGSTSRYGLIAFASSLEQIGAMGKNTADTALLQSIISGPDCRDSTCERPVAADFSIPANGLNGLVIGVSDEFFGEGISQPARDSVMRTLRFAEQLGAVLKPVDLPNIRHAVSSYYIISSAEASSNLGRYDSIRFGHRTKNGDFIRTSRCEGFGTEVKRRILLGTFVLSAGYAEQYYRRAMRMREQISEDFDKAFSECDIIAAPTCIGSAFPLGQHPEDPTQAYSADICTVPASLAGIPAISFPCGSDSNGLPLGIQLMGAKYSERLLFRAASSFEREWGDFQEIINMGGV